VDFPKLLPQPLLLPGQHRFFFRPPRLAATENKLLLALAIGMGQEFDFDVGAHLFPVLVFEQCSFELAQLRLGCAEEVLRVALAQKWDVLLADLPRSMTQMRLAWPDFSSMTITMSATVVTSAWLPANTS